jgi:APA family basic amino acid/polyamine antiporter
MVWHQLAGWLFAMWVLTGTITVIAAVSYGELSDVLRWYIT